MKLISICIIAVMMLSGCGKVTMDDNDKAMMQATLKAQENCMVEKYKVEAAAFKGVTDVKDRALIVAMQALANAVNPNPCKVTNFYDYAMVEAQERTKRVGHYVSFGSAVVSGTVTGFTAYWSSHTLSDAIKKSGNQTIVGGNYVGRDQTTTTTTITESGNTSSTE